MHPNNSNNVSSHRALNSVNSSYSIVASLLIYLLLPTVSEMFHQGTDWYNKRQTCSVFSFQRLCLCFGLIKQAEKPSPCEGSLVMDVSSPAHHASHFLRTWFHIKSLKWTLSMSCCFFLFEACTAAEIEEPSEDGDLLYHSTGQF